MAVEGRYEVVAKTKLGTGMGIIELVTSGNALAGIAVGMNRTGEITDGVVTGDSFTCKLTAPVKKKQVTVKVKGVVTGDIITGSFRYGPMRIKYEGKRLND